MCQVQLVIPVDLVTAKWRMQFNKCLPISAVPGIPDTEDTAVTCIETLLSRSFHFTGGRLMAKGHFL